MIVLSISCGKEKVSSCLHWVCYYSVVTILQGPPRLYLLLPLHSGPSPAAFCYIQTHSVIFFLSIYLTSPPQLTRRLTWQCVVYSLPVLPRFCGLRILCVTFPLYFLTSLSYFCTFVPCDEWTCLNNVTNFVSWYIHEMLRSREYCR